MITGYELSVERHGDAVTISNGVGRKVVLQTVDDLFKVHDALAGIIRDVTWARLNMIQKMVEE